MNEPTNPYAPPKMTPAPVDEAEEFTFIEASAGARFVNFIVDLVCRVLLNFALVWLLISAGLELDGVTNFLLQLLIALVYYVAFETLFGRTPGKFITGTRVVKTDGSTITAADIFVRTLARAVPFEPFSMFGSDGPWHDRWSKTRVIPIRRR